MPAGRGSQRRVEFCHRAESPAQQRLGEQHGEVRHELVAVDDLEPFGERDLGHTKRALDQVQSRSVHRQRADADVAGSQALEERIGAPREVGANLKHDDLHSVATAGEPERLALQRTLDPAIVETRCQQHDLARHGALPLPSVEGAGK